MSKEIPQEEIPFSKGDNQISMNPPKKEITPPQTYTPLSQDAKPFLSKRLKNINSQKSNEQLNKNEMKRINYVKKNDFNESPIFSYFNSSQKYLSEEYAKNININKDNDETNENNEIDDDSEEGENDEESDNEEESEKNENIEQNFQNRNINYFNQINNNNNSIQNISFHNMNNMNNNNNLNNLNNLNNIFKILIIII